MKLEERKVAVGDLMIGMYVCRLDRDWADTPFPLQGLLIRSRDDIDAIAQYAEFVYIDIELGLGPRDARVGVLPRARQHDGIPITDLQRLVSYDNTALFDDELPRAREAHGKAAEFAGKILDDVREGRPISADDVRHTVEPMVQSILRNADAFFWLESLRKRGTYDYNHALNCSALSAAFGRHIGFPEEILTDLASGGLLMDIGKLRVSEEIIGRKGPLAASEVTEVRRHVELGMQILDEGSALPSHARDMLRAHHERYDGSGYPDGLAGAQIPLLGRIAAVIDSFDAMTSDRSYRKGISKHAGLQELYRARDTLYAAEIVEQFMQCLSVYPTGSLVELNNGQVALVMAQNPARRLSPRVMLLTSPDKQLESYFRPLDLTSSPQDGSAPLRIVQTLEPGAYGLDPAELYL